MATEQLVGSLPATWEYTTLGELCGRGGGGIQTGPFGSQLHASDYIAHGIPSIMPANIGENRVLRDGIAEISVDDAERLQRYRVRTGDIVYSRRGDVERRALIRESEDGWLCGTGCLRVRFGDDHVDARFASYYLGDPRVREWIVRHAHGATMPNLNTAILSALPFVVAPLSEQRAIARILGAVDDKIELNRRMNETLESMARALFRSWFVDFDPVRSKAESRDLNMPKSLFDLFPDAFEDSELGAIPKGWEVVPIGTLADVVGGSTPSTTEPSYWQDGTHHWATPKDLAGLSLPVLLDTERRVTDKGLAQISSGLLAAGTVLLSSRAPIGYLAIAEIPVAINQGFIALKPTGHASSLFLLLWATFAQDEIVSRANGSTFLEISKASFRPIPVAVPPAALSQAFESLAYPFYKALVAGARQSRTLVALRDTLLPKLVSGEIRVRDAEKMVEVAI